MVTMSGDTLVIKLVQPGTVGYGEISQLVDVCTTYVFYDYKTELFGVRCKYTRKQGTVGSFSYYSDNKAVLTDFLVESLEVPSMAEISLVTMSGLPIDSDEITFDILSESDQDTNVISGYTNNSDLEDGDSKDDEERFPDTTIKQYLNIIEAVYNEY
jgi:hypothetical protein